MDGVPGSRSTARTHRASVVPVASVTSCVSSILSAATVNSAGIRSARSGAPIVHSFLSATSGSFWSSAPRGLPPVAHVRMMSISFGDSVCARLRSPKPSSAFQGGMCAETSSARIDSAHGNASS